METKLFMILFKINRFCEAKIRMEMGACSYKQRAFYSIIGGFAKAGTFILS